jgi:hypothetical protein
MTTWILLFLELESKPTLFVDYILILELLIRSLIELELVWNLFSINSISLDSTITLVLEYNILYTFEFTA